MYLWEAIHIDGLYQWVLLPYVMLTYFICVRLFETYRLQTARLLCHGDSPGKNPGVGCHALLQGIFPVSPALQAGFLPTEPL